MSVEIALGSFCNFLESCRIPEEQNKTGEGLLHTHLLSAKNLDSAKSCLIEVGKTANGKEWLFKDQIEKINRIFDQEIGIITKILFEREVEGVDALELDASLDEIIKEVKKAAPASAQAAFDDSAAPASAQAAVDDSAAPAYAQAAVAQTAQVKAADSAAEDAKLKIPVIQTIAVAVETVISTGVGVFGSGIQAAGIYCCFHPIMFAVIFSIVAGFITVFLGKILLANLVKSNEELLPIIKNYSIGKRLIVASILSALSLATALYFLGAASLAISLVSGFFAVVFVLIVNDVISVPSALEKEDEKRVAAAAAFADAAQVADKAEDFAHCTPDPPVLEFVGSE